MALRRRFDQRPLVGAGPGFRRAFLIAFGTANLRLGDNQPAIVEWLRLGMLAISIAPW